MTDLEQAINRAIEDVCMRIRDLPNETRYDGVELDKAGLHWAQAIHLLCQARSEVLSNPILEPEPSDLVKELTARCAEENFRNLANL